MLPDCEMRLTGTLGVCGSLALLLGVVARLVVGYRSHRVSAFWTRAGTWGIAYSQKPAGGSAASWLLATAYPAVVPALLSGSYFGCGSYRKKISDLVLLILYFLKRSLRTALHPIQRRRLPPAPKWEQ
ncbi:hypothetical protein CSV65_13635 [Sporosarcina sp. P31]|nr:hypothetical protein CSV66_13435 [Sporosarcina sp. P30]PID07922.1 hypothetical protein CSV65_13635 [Sporosarcina sp. P31]PID11108.1 hypothetical protein CSV64_13665 [Sporosarcina sp. P32b]